MATASASSAALRSAPVRAQPGLVALLRPQGEAGRSRMAAVTLMLAGGLASAANLLSTVIVARFLSTNAYGALTKLIGVFLVLSMPGLALMVGVVRRLTAWESAGRLHESQRWLARCYRVAFGALAVVVAAVWLARTPLAHLLRLPGSAGLVEAVLAGGVWILVVIDRALLQSHRRYGVLSVNLVIEGLSRTAAMIVLTAAGLGLQGAALGLLIGELCAAAHVRLAAARMWRTTPAAGDVAVVEAEASVVAHTARDLFGDVAVAMLAMALLAALQNADVLIFGTRVPGGSGSYAAVSVPSKALVFLALLFGNYLLPEASIRFHAGRHALRQLGHTLVLLSLPALVLLSIAVVLPGHFLGLVFGTKYEAGAAGLTPLVLAMTLLCVTVVLTLYLLGVGWRWVVVPLAIGTAVLVALCASAGRTVVQTTHADLITQACLAAVMVGLLVGRHRFTFSRRPRLPEFALLPAESTTTPA